ncbi:hypothetical protein [Novosphingobium jiangmenense]|uniref:Lipoprotein n=1 Tax=Novosphingobium jiangmenense TaxID=2791981 RepID=A0ABS0HCS4_9SPHN|nr:hypothetical protein [Novosphingobium jiangmenense]MBF9150027.1 hypothetical protein [Novosphingobium jiangmenense]
MTKAILALLPAIALASCAVIPKVERTDGFASIGETTLVGSAKIRPDSLIEDSRCPMNARCVWAGRVIIEATVMRGGGFETRRFTLGEAVDGLMLDTVEPGRMTDTQLKPSDYRSHFSVAP